MNDSEPAPKNEAQEEKGLTPLDILILVALFPLDEKCEIALVVAHDDTPPCYEVCVYTVEAEKEAPNLLSRLKTNHPEVGFTWKVMGPGGDMRPGGRCIHVVG